MNIFDVFNVLSRSGGGGYDPRMDLKGGSRQCSNEMNWRRFEGGATITAGRAINHIHRGQTSQTRDVNWLSTDREIGQEQSDFPNVMQITRATDYAVRIMIHLATLPDGMRVAAPQVARGIEAPESFVSKVLQQLVQRGMVTSHRGAGGGFQLAVDPAGVSLLDVVEIVEGPLQINLCLPGEATCDRKSWCGAHPIWNEAQDALKKVLSSATIAEMARDSVANLTKAKESAANGRVQIGPAEPERPDRRHG